MATSTDTVRRFGNNMVCINGIVSSSYIGCFVPFVVNYLIPSARSNSTPKNVVTAAQSNYLLISSFILGISNLMTLPDSRSSGIKQLTQNVCSFTTILTANIFNCKYHSNTNNKKYFYFNIALNSFLLFSCIRSIYNKRSSKSIKSISELLRQIKRDEIKYVRFEVTNISAQGTGMLVPARHCEHFFRKGFPFVPIVSIATVNNGFGAVDKYFGHTGYRNVPMFPDVTSYKLIPWQEHKTASVLLAQDTSFDKMYPIDTRTLCLRLLSKLHDTFNLDLFASIEHEFYLLDTDNKPISEAGVYKLDRMSACQSLFCKMDEYFYAMGINCERMHSEVSRGQYEITALPAFNIKSADDAYWIRSGVREICTLHSDYRATFVTHLPQAIDGDFNSVEDDNNGSHFNHSLFVRNGTKQQNVLWDNDKNELSQVALYWIGGIMKHIGSITALVCPTSSCYESRWESPWVSGNADWGFADRTVLIRVKPSANNTHFELRLPSGLANPYFILASVICAGMIGIENKILPPKAKGSAAREEKEKESDTTFVTQLPKTLEEALNVLEKDKVFSEKMDALLIDSYIKTKRMEIDEMKQYAERKETPLFYSLF